MNVGSRRIRIVGAFLLFAFAFIGGWLQTSRANLYPYEPLDKVPRAEDVFAFASYPPVPTPSQDPSLPPERQMARDDLLLFLREGVKVGPEQETPVDAGSWCRGVFFTSDGAAYFWSLVSGQALYIISSDYKSCTLVLKQSRVQARAVPRGSDEFTPLKLPRAGDVLYFANADRPGEGFQIKRAKKDVQRFLLLGKALQYATFSDRWKIRQPARLTLPNDLLEKYKRFGLPVEKNKVTSMDLNVSVGGVFVTRDAKVYFWEQLGDDLMQISDGGTAECALKLP